MTKNWLKTVITVGTIIIIIFVAIEIMICYETTNVTSSVKQNHHSIWKHI